MNTKKELPRIVKTPDVCGGRPRLDGHRIRVQDIVYWVEIMGQTPDWVARELNIGMAKVHIALAYYFNSPAEIQNAFRKDKAFVLGCVKKELKQTEEGLFMNRLTIKPRVCGVLKELWDNNEDSIYDNL